MASKSLRLLTQILGFAFCVVIGTWVATLSDEIWLVAVAAGMGLIVFSIIGTYNESRRTQFSNWLVGLVNSFGQISI
jgi:hypothetical protein